MVKFLWIAAGGAIGALLRYSFSGLIYKQISGIFPWGTLGVNALGCFAAGFLWELFERVIVPQDLRLFIFVGILGGFTTFSTYALESVNLMRDSEIKSMAFNIIMTNVLCLVLLFLGLIFCRLLLNCLK